MILRLSIFKTKRLLRGPFLMKTPPPSGEGRGASLGGHCRNNWESVSKVSITETLLKCNS